MLFNSWEFALFLPIVFLLYWFFSPAEHGKGTGPRYSLFNYMAVNERTAVRIQNILILAASYMFYGWWDWRFLFLIAFTSFCSWGTGLLIGSQQSAVSSQRSAHARLWLTANIVINVGILAVFKYYDFFMSEFGRLFGMDTDSLLLKIILPVGISFYTFQAIGYSVDVYRRKIEPTRDVVAFFAFISFFPQLVAGPIERATNLLPQFQNKRTFNYEQATDGVRQILWGLFKKIVVADTCATYVDMVWQQYSTQAGSTLLLAAVLFTFQIYADFSGYSDIAIGTAKLFGIRLMRNFNNPYFSRDIAEFWRRWHISLTTWFRDYVYIPLGGSRPDIPAQARNPERYRKRIIVRNTFVIFLLSGFWHGANWTFIAWGVYHAVLFLPLILLGKNRKYTNGIAEGRLLPTWKECLQILCTFALAVVGWIIFRAESITQAWYFVSGISDSSLFVAPKWFGGWYLTSICLYVVIMLLIEWIQRDRQHGLQHSSDSKLSKGWSVVLYYCIMLLILIYGMDSHQTFIYFQF